MTFAPLTDAEMLWLENHWRQASALVGDLEGTDLPSLRQLDDVFVDFISLGDAANERANSFVLSVGAAFGEHLVRSLGFAWCIATDDWGTDIAVRARPDRGDITIFPTNFVAKRWESKDAPFLVYSRQQISESLAASAREWGDTQTS
jgi:Domain of unknown function (DUF3806)